MKSAIDINLWEFVRDESFARGWSTEETANKLGLTNEQYFSSFAHQDYKVGLAFAHSLSEAFGQSTEFWKKLIEQHNKERK